MRNDALGIALISSLAIHICAIMMASSFFHTSPLKRENLFRAHLIELASPEAPPLQRTETTAEIRKTPPPPVAVEKPKRTIPPMAKAPALQPELPAPSLAVKKEPARAIATSPEPVKLAPAPSDPSESVLDGGGNGTGAANLSEKETVGVISGAGGSRGGDTTHPAGLSDGSGASGSPAETPPLQTRREAKPLQTARAVYPPMALRAGVESDVTLRIEVDSEGRVTSAEVTRSGGGSFDEEALKAVKKSRFEPAQRNGQAIAAEFTYIYRFRLRR